MLSNSEYLEEQFFAHSLVCNSSDKSQFLIFKKIPNAANWSCKDVVETTTKRIIPCTTLNNKLLEPSSVPIRRGAYCESTRKKPLRGNKREQRHKAAAILLEEYSGFDAAIVDNGDRRSLLSPLLSTPTFVTAVVAAVVDPDRHRGDKGPDRNPTPYEGIGCRLQVKVRFS
ncbi:hypothetical protein Y032_0008g191 [Ancylostoma ceylanicum]|uniref:Uncharacterized protein n=1 Tax=Ancylostoma ceylanicum TaxID=53326 RepID=A0A016VKH9_9BILA|nr:hypothetical protein Y032_0008g191 [Ancylostoma ceylanicum]